jgi:ABC-type hemin transport system ATPase subunit
MRKPLSRGRGFLLALAAALYADRVALLVGGRLQQVGTPVQVLTEARLSAAFQTPVRVISHPEYGLLLVMPGGGHVSEQPGW